MKKIILLAAITLLTNCKKTTKEPTKITEYKYSYDVHLVNYTQEELTAKDKLARIIEVLWKNGEKVTNVVTINTNNGPNGGSTTGTLTYAKEVKVVDGDVLIYKALCSGQLLRPKPLVRLVITNLTLGTVVGEAFSDTTNNTVGIITHTVVIPK